VAEGEAYSEYLGTNDRPSKTTEPRPLPMQALDHAAGYLLAFGANAALCKTITVRMCSDSHIIWLLNILLALFQEGGSWEVNVSLAAVGQWIRSLGRVPPQEAFGEGKPLPSSMFPQDEEIRRLSTPWTQSNLSISGRMTALKHAGVLSHTPVREGRVEEGEPGAPLVLNSSTAVW